MALSAQRLTWTTLHDLVCEIPRQPSLKILSAAKSECRRLAEAHLHPSPALGVDLSEPLALKFVKCYLTRQPELS
jgi:hypothetical protein